MVTASQTWTHAEEPSARYRRLRHGVGIRSGRRRPNRSRNMGRHPVRLGPRQTFRSHTLNSEAGRFIRIRSPAKLEPLNRPRPRPESRSRTWRAVRPCASRSTPAWSDLDPRADVGAGSLELGSDDHQPGPVVGCASTSVQDVNGPLQGARPTTLDQSRPCVVLPGPPQRARLRRSSRGGDVRLGVGQEPSVHGVADARFSARMASLDFCSACLRR